MNKKTLLGVTGTVAAVAVGAAVLLGPATGEAPPPITSVAGDAGTEITVYKSRTCGCCNAWIEHMEANGFRVTPVNVDATGDLMQLKARHGITANLASCHTGLVGGYVIEGHVPADLVHRLLAESPPVKGLAVPGMPVGSPGMEGPRKEDYDVLSFDAQGNTEVYAER